MPHCRSLVLVALLGSFIVPGLAQPEQTAIVLASPTMRPGTRGYLTVLLTNSPGVSVGQLQHWIEVPAGKITYVSSRSGIAADLAKAEVGVDVQEKEEGGFLLHLAVKAEKPLPDGPIAEVTFDVGEVEPETLTIPHRMEALDAEGEPVPALDFSDWELVVAEELPEAPPAIFSCFFYMHQ